MLKIEKYFIKFEGRDIKDKAIPIDYLGNVLRSFQSLFQKMAILFFPNLRKAWTKMVLTDIERGGSSVATIELKNPELIMPETTQKLRDSLFKTFEIIHIEDPDQAYKKIQNFITKSYDRIEIYRNLKNMWSIKKITTSIGSGYSYKGLNFTKLEKEKKPRIKKWIKRETTEKMISIRGFLTRIRIDGTPAYFTLIDENGESIRVDFEIEDLQTYKELLTKPIIIKGLVELKGREKIMRKIEDIKEFYTVTVEKTPKYKLSQSLIFSVEFIDDGILLSEPSIPLNLDIDKLTDLETELEEYFDFLKETYIDIIPDKLDSKAKEFRSKLIKLLNLEE